MRKAIAFVARRDVQQQNRKARGVGELGPGDAGDVAEHGFGKCDAQDHDALTHADSLEPCEESHLRQTKEYGETVRE